MGFYLRKNRHAGGRAGLGWARIWPCWARWAARWLDWAWGLAVLGALGWVGWARWLGVVLGVGFGVLGALAGLGVVLGVLGALAGLGVVLGVGFGRAGRAGCAGRTALGWAWGWASAVIVFSSSNAINKQTTQNTKLKGKDRPIMNSKS